VRCNSFVVGLLVLLVFLAVLSRFIEKNILSWPCQSHPGAITWVSATGGVATEFRLYNHLFTVESPGDDTWEAELNPNSLEIKAHGRGACVCTWVVDQS
jgi:hypothetical protein